MNPTAIYSKSGKGVQEATGKTSYLSRADRALLSAFDGRLIIAEVAQKVGKPFDATFEQLVAKLEKDGFIREVSPGVAPAAPPKAAPKGKPGALEETGESLDFTQGMKVPKRAPGAPPQPQVDLAAKAREDAERRAKDEEAISYKARHEAEAKAKAEAAVKERAERDARLRVEAEAKARAEAEAKVKAAHDAALRVAAEARAKAEAETKAKREAERRAREETERKAREEADTVKREAEELRKRLEEERKAREEVERKAREEAERARREAEEKARREAEERARREAEERRKREEEERRREEEERRKREEEERRAREEAERRKREEERARREAEEKAKREAEERAKREEAERRKREEEDKRRREEERRRKEEEERRAREAEERRRREEEVRRREEQERRERDEAERRRREEEEAALARREAEAKPAAAAGAGLGDALLADLESFSQREDEERRARDEGERKAKAEKERRAKEEAEREAKEQAERQRREQEERRRREEQERREREEQERSAREEEERAAREAEDRKRRARETLAAAQKPQEDDIGVTEEDLDMEDVRRDEQLLSKKARRAAREREHEEKDEKKQKEAEEAIVAAPPPKTRRPVKWGRPVAFALFVLLAAGIAAIHVVPVSTADYEKAATEALGVPVKIGSGRLWVITGVQLRFSGVAVGEARVAQLRASPAIGSLFGENKIFSRIELEGAVLPQSALGDVLFGAPRSRRFSVERIVAKELKLEGPLALPALEAELAFAGNGALRSASVRGPDGLVAKLAPKESRLEFEATATSFALPFAPEVSLKNFDMKGSATRRGMTIEAWGGGALDGVVSGAANVQWGPSWTVEGALTVRGINAGVFAPALLSEGRAEGSGKFVYNGTEPAKLAAGLRVDGNFTITKGVLGSFDLSRALQTGGRQAQGRTPFAELTGQGSYDKGAVQLRNVTIGAGRLNAGASADIDASGALSGRIVADVKTATQTQRATLNLGGTVKEPQVK